MCNRYGGEFSWSELVDMFRAQDLPIVSPGPEAAPNLPPVEDIRPTDLTPVLRPVVGGVELVKLRWGLIPYFHKGGIKDWKATTFNCRGETAATSGAFKGAFARRRCLVPATPFFEWTGPKGKKVKWRIVRRDGAPFTFAGIWDRAHTADGTVESFTLLTCAPGPDIAPLHDRQPVIVEPADWKAWLDPANPADRIVRAAPAGTLVYGPAEAPRAA